MLQVLLSNGSLFQLLILIPFPPGQMGNVAASCWRRSGLSEEKSARTRTRTYFVETKGYVLQTVAFPFLQTAQQASVCVFFLSILTNITAETVACPTREQNPAKMDRAFLDL